MTTEKPCSTHPEAPHGFVRNASYNAGHYVCECSGWTPPEPGSLQERLRNPQSIEVLTRAAEDGADRIDSLEADVAEYRKCADDAAMAHKVERDELMADKEVLLGLMATIRDCTNDPAISRLAHLVLERMAQGGGK